MSEISSNYQVGRYLQNNDITIADSQTDKALGEIFEIDKLTKPNFFSLPYSKGAQEFLNLLSSFHRDYLGIEDKSIDPEDLPTIALEKDFESLLGASRYQLLYSGLSLENTIAFVSKYEVEGLNRINDFIKEKQGSLNWYQRFSLKDNLKLIARSDKINLSNELKEIIDQTIN